MQINVPPPSMADDLIRAGEESRHLDFNGGNDAFLADVQTWSDNDRLVALRHLVVGLTGAGLAEKKETVNAVSVCLNDNVRHWHVHSAIFGHGMLRYIDSAVMALTQAHGLTAIKQGKLNPFHLIGDHTMPPLPRSLRRALFDEKIKSGLMGARRDVAVVGHVINTIAEVSA